MKILLPIDGSDCSKKTLRWVIELFRNNQHSFYLLYVIDLIQEKPWDSDQFEKAQHVLDGAKAYLEQAGLDVVETKYVRGMPSQEIRHFADKEGIDQIIMGSHGRQGLSKFLMGSVSEDVFKHAKQTIMIINNGPMSSIKTKYSQEALK